MRRQALLSFLVACYSSAARQFAESRPKKPRDATSPSSKPASTLGAWGLEAPTTRQIHASGDTVVVSFDASGTARGGQTYATTYAWFLGRRDSRIVSAFAFFDSVTFNDLWQRVQPANQNQLSGMHRAKGADDDRTISGADTRCR